MLPKLLVFVAKNQLIEICFVPGAATAALNCSQLISSSFRQQKISHVGY